jgi:hypothetical protein
MRQYNVVIRERQRAARERLYATPAQVVYLRRLLIEADAALFPHPGFDTHHLERIRKDEASAEIDRLKRAREAAWLRADLRTSSAQGNQPERPEK